MHPIGGSGRGNRRPRTTEDECRQVPSKEDQPRGECGVSQRLIGSAQSALGRTTSSRWFERVEITGPQLRQIESEISLPTTLISAVDLRNTGVSNAEQALRLLARVDAGLASSGSYNSARRGRWGTLRVPSAGAV